MNVSRSSDLIERYVAAVGRKLPRRMRNDVENELRSSLLDMLEDRDLSSGQISEDEIGLEILRQMDPPAKMAARYTGSQYLIGPRLFQAFRWAVRIQLIVIVAQFIFGVLIGLSRSATGDTLGAIGESMNWLPAAIFGSIGFLVVIFAFLERILPKDEVSQEKDWDPRKLPPVESPDLISPSRAVVKILSVTFALMFINFFRHWVGVSYFENGSWQHVSALTPAFLTYVLPLNLVLALVILLYLYLLRQGEWQPVTRWMRIALTLFEIVILLTMIAGPSVAYISPERMPPIGGDSTFDMDPLLILIAIWLALLLVRDFLRHRPYLQIPLSR
ncbi:MAG: hypothetical protein GTO14_12070 [Anaerolineales bacterium]|nr:hypothetical protein [Anaerolineales bacterium]